MMTLYDYLPSQNGYKVRLLLSHLAIPYRVREVRIFDGAARTPEFLARNPAGAVPVLELADGRTLPESNAILCYLAEGSPYVAADSWLRAQQLRWLFWEEDAIQNGLATLRHWTLTGKLARRSPELVAARRAAAERSLEVLARALSGRAFLTESGYSIADMSVFAYASRADEAGISLERHPPVQDWVRRVRAQPGFLDVVHPYHLDPRSTHELP
jgi:glutathione S-transferase